MIAEQVQRLFREAGITINGDAPWDIRVHDDRFYSRLVRERSLGLGESYMDGWWDCDAMDEMIRRLLLSDIARRVPSGLSEKMRFLPGYLFNLQSLRRARAVAQHHYNLDHALFYSFLDPYRQYSCAFFDHTDDLAQAQQNKLALIAAKLDLQPTDHLLDIGCGWGGLARYCAEHHGCTVTGINISTAQLKEAESFCRGWPVHVYNRDYRLIDGQFDKIVSVGMFEHVGCKNYRTFMDVAHRSLKNDGIFLLHTIGRNTSAHYADPWLTKYIFPNSMLPSLQQISDAIEDLFIIEDVHNFGPHYDKTLMAWHANFLHAWPTLAHKYDERFKRMWTYYLLSCAGAFRARTIQLWQIVMTREGSGSPQPPRMRARPF